MSEILVPIFVCVVLPVSIVAIIFAAITNKVNKRSQILIKAIESNSGIDVDKLAEALQSPKRTAREILNLRLLRGCIFSFIGLVLIVTGIVFLCIGPGFGAVSVQLPFIFGGISFAIGLSYLVVYNVSRKEIKE